MRIECACFGVIFEVCRRKLGEALFEVSERGVGVSLSAGFLMDGLRWGFLSCKSGRRNLTRMKDFFFNLYEF